MHVNNYKSDNRLEAYETIYPGYLCFRVGAHTSRMSDEDYNIQQAVDAAYEKLERSLASANILPDSGGQVNAVSMSLQNNLL